MYILTSVFILIAAVLLILIVLVQNSKGGGLASNFSASNQVMGVKKTTDFLEKATWGLSTSILVLCIVAAATVGGHETATESIIKDKVENAYTPSEAQNFPTDVATEETPATKEAE